MRFRNAIYKMSRYCSYTGKKINVTETVFFLNKSTSHVKYFSVLSQANNFKKKFPYGFISMCILGFSSLAIYSVNNVLQSYAATVQDDDDDEDKFVAGEYINGLPVYSASEVAKHNSQQNGIWITYKNGVYDVTDFVEEHPGGDKILLGAGASIEPFWLIYGVHNNPEVYRLLESFRIGNVNPAEKEHQVVAADPYIADPQRNPLLQVASAKPFNAEPPPPVLIERFHTPNDIFYVRNHLPVPVVDPKTYRLVITGLGLPEEVSLSLDEIKAFPKHTVTAAVQCAGNRRSEMMKVPGKEVKGLVWRQSAIGNATWSGARLVDVLAKCGFEYNHRIEHIQLEGLDKGPEGVPYGASVPARKALDPLGDVILAYQMNGEELPRDHGYPVRIIVPGIVGARNVKWLSKIVLSEKESDSHWQQNDYKGFSPSTGWDTVDFSSSPAVQELPVTSAICFPLEGETVEVREGRITVKGYAWSGGGRPIIRVDVTSDQGKTWHVASLERTDDKASQAWAWTLWNIDIPTDRLAEKAEIWVKAVDSSYNTQPESVENIWNLRGILTTSYHKVNVKLKHANGSVE